MSKISYKVGDRFGKLVIEKSSQKKLTTSNRKLCTVICKCDCGGRTETTITKLRMGHTRSCGCLFTEAITKHNMCESPEYKSWASLKDRCLNKNNNRYYDYGGRGIKVCDRWLKFENFYDDMGKRPKNTTIDRIDNNGNYCKENCKWSTKLEQIINRRNTIRFEVGGVNKTAKQWAKELGIEYCTLITRINRGWDIESAIFKPVAKYTRR